jgi:pimeloyl-ACP methyl ester carboxylesterase
VVMTNSTRIRPFRIDIPQADLDELNTRLAKTRWPEELPGVGWKYGTPSSYLKQLTDYWRSGYDWRAEEARLNRHPQFLFEHEDRRLHFWHIRSEEPAATPLLLIHGWPFGDFSAMIDPLIDPRSHGGGPAFHLVIPTLPGFGFSGLTRQPGQGATDRSAELIAALMAELGYDRYLAQGGDAGSFIAPQIGRIDTEHVIGVHVNDPITIPSWDDDGSGYDEADQANLAKLQQWGNDSTSAYAGSHGRSQTLANGLNDSPAGLLSWVIDVVHTYIDPAKELPEEAMDRDRVLTAVSILWFTGTIGSSMLLYSESDQWGAELPNSGVPTGIAVFAGGSSIRGIAERQNTVVHWARYDRGGHFASMEVPDLLIKDLRTFVTGLA